MLCLSFGLTKIAEWLIDNYYVDESHQEEAFKIVDHGIQNLVHLAVLNQDPEFLAKALKMKGANTVIEDADKEGLTPLTLAVREYGEDAVDLVETLVRGGASLDTKDGNGNTALSLAEDLADGESAFLKVAISRL